MAIMVAMVLVGAEVLVGWEAKEVAWGQTDATETMVVVGGGGYGCSGYVSSNPSKYYSYNVANHFSQLISEYGASLIKEEEDKEIKRKEMQKRMQEEMERKIRGKKNSKRKR